LGDQFHFTIPVNLLADADGTDGINVHVAVLIDLPTDTHGAVGNQGDAAVLINLLTDFDTHFGLDIHRAMLVNLLIDRHLAGGAHQSDSAVLVNFFQDNVVVVGSINMLAVCDLAKI
jgi:hypothetical protein